MEWVVTTANAAGTNGFACLPKHGGARDSKFCSYIPWLTFADVSFSYHTPNALTAGPTYKAYYLLNIKNTNDQSVLKTFL
jgi:hypothetical protein